MAKRLLVRLRATLSQLTGYENESQKDPDIALFYK